MRWHFLTRFPGLAEGIPGGGAPVDTVTTNLISYVVSWGTLGVFALIAGWLLLRGWRLMSPSDTEAVRAAARMEGRADLLAEQERLILEKREIQQQRDDALQIAQTQLAPLLTSFVGTTNALVPILQEIIRDSPSWRQRGGTNP